jgi:hypothetical protein
MVTVPRLLGKTKAVKGERVGNEVDGNGRMRCRGSNSETNRNI